MLRQRSGETFSHVTEVEAECSLENSSVPHPSLGTSHGDTLEAAVTNVANNTRMLTYSQLFSS